MKKVKILLVDDHKLVLDGFNMILSHHEPFEVVGIAKDGFQAIKMSAELVADVVLMDINLPNLNGIEATREIKKKRPDTKIIMLSMNDDEEYVVKADQVGADAYLLKNIEKEELIDAIDKVLSGEKYYSKSLSAELVFNIQNKKYLKEGNSKSVLTLREIDIINELSLGSSNKEIADRLLISERTVNTHKTNIYKKLDVKNSVELLLKVKEKKLI